MCGVVWRVGCHRPPPRPFPDSRWLYHNQCAERRCVFSIGPVSVGADGWVKVEELCAVWEISSENPHAQVFMSGEWPG
jgi:hypothetical protein